MGLSDAKDAVARESVQLLPPGEAWQPRPDSVLARLLRALGGPLAVLEERARDLIDEADPRTTFELLADWEAALGLPDACLPNPQSDAERRALVLARVAGAASGTPAFFVALAASIGVPIAIEEGRADPARVNVTRVGDRLNGEVEDLVWTVFAPSTPVIRARVNSARIGDPLSTYGNSLLECVLRRYAPAHTYLRFSYDTDGLLLRIAIAGGDVAVAIEGSTLRVSTGSGFFSIPIDGDELLVGIPGGPALRIQLDPS